MDKLLLFLLVLFACVYQSQSWWQKKKWPVTATGYVKCFGRALPKVRVQLMDDDWGSDEMMGSYASQTNGFFVVSGKANDGWNGKPEPYIKVEYIHTGELGDYRVIDGHSVVDDDRNKHVSYKKEINFGVINFKSRECKIYLAFYDALEEYHQRTRLTSPYNRIQLIDQIGALNKNNARTTFGNIYNSDVDLPLNKITKEHFAFQLAQLILYARDTDCYLHHKHDAKVHKYDQPKSCALRTTPGNAFSKGWAWFWVGGCTLEGGYGSYLTDYRYQGNVAQALRRLMTKCSSSYNNFLSVLSEGRGRIHSIYAFNCYHEKVYKCKLT